MANTKISQLTALTTPTWWEELVYAYNNANGKMTLNTMKWYVENNLSWYVTTSDLTTWLAWKQDTLVSGTNIRTINGSSVLWNWNLDISWWVAYTAWNWIDITWWVISVVWWVWGSWFDCTVASDWTWDYTTIGDAITAWKKSLFVKDWTYTMSTWTLSTWDFKMVWESRNWVVIDITYPTRSWTIFTLTSDTTSATNSFLFQNLTFNITYTWNFWYFIMFGWMWAWKWFLKISDCTINIPEATNWCNFYISSGSYDENTLVEKSLINISPTVWSFTELWFLWMRKWTCIESVINIDADQSIWTSWITFNWNAQWAYISCQFNIWVNHATLGDIASAWAEDWYSCRYTQSNQAKLRIYWRQVSCTFGFYWTNASIYDSDLNTAVTWKKISIWKPNTAYTVWQYVMSWRSTTLARCTTAHTSWASYDSTKFTDTYWDVFIQGWLSQCNLTVWWTVIISWTSLYNDTLVQPSNTIDINNNLFRCSNPSSWLWISYCNFILLSNRWFNHNAIAWDDWLSTSVNVYIWWESATFCWNRIVASTWYIYSWWYWNVITSNIFTYITWQTTPTITQVTSWASEIANNVIRWVADWHS